MSDILATILARKAEEVRERSAALPLRELSARCEGLPPTRGFADAVQAGQLADVPPYHAAGITGAGQVLMVLDNGIQLDAADLVVGYLAAGREWAALPDVTALLESEDENPDRRRAAVHDLRVGRQRRERDALVAPRTRPPRARTGAAPGYRAACAVRRSASSDRVPGICAVTKRKCRSSVGVGSQAQAGLPTMLSGCWVTCSKSSSSVAALR